MDWIQQAWSAITKKVLRNSTDIGASFPHLSQSGKYENSEGSFWTKGFWPGILWHVYEDTKEPVLKEIANKCEAILDNDLLNFYVLHHDMGFVWSLSSVAQYKLTGNTDSRRRALTAASHLAGRFNVKGNFIRAWNEKQAMNGEDNSGWAIIDCTMNLPLLYWASIETKDPRFKHIAMAHADTVLKEFLRDDGSVYHIVCFDSKTGDRIGERAGQGARIDSAWARGVAWAIYGLALSYHYTGEKRYLDGAKRSAQFFINNLPEDSVPYWDFKIEVNADTPRDTSAAACAASGMLEIARLTDCAAEKQEYQHAAKTILRSLYQKYGEWTEKEQGMLLCGTSNMLVGVGINVPIIYGDYFFTEAIHKLMGYQNLFW